MSFQKKQIFFLHFAGGNSYSFQFLTKKIDSDIKVHTLELPGRGKRMNENLITNYKDAVNDYLKQIKSLRTDSEYIIYGHSMGAILGFLVAAEMEKLGDHPQKIVLTGNSGPGFYETSKNKRYLLNDEDLKKELLDLGGVSKEVLNNKDLFEFFNPILRADFRVLEQEDIPGPKVNCPIYALMGSEEEQVDQINNWGNYTTGKFESEVLPGGHFFIFDHPERIAKIIEMKAKEWAV